MELKYAYGSSPLPSFMQLEDIQTPQDLFAYIIEYQDAIYVREQIDGKWGSFALNELPDDVRQRHIIRFLDEGRVPVRIKRDDEA